MGTIGMIRNRSPMARLNESERRQLKELGLPEAKKLIKLSRETFNELSDPNGVATPNTVMRIRKKLAVLRGEATEEETSLV